MGIIEKKEIKQTESTFYVTSDGQKFGTKSQAISHETGIEKEKIRKKTESIFKTTCPFSTLPKELELDELLWYYPKTEEEAKALQEWFGIFCEKPFEIKPGDFYTYFSQDDGWGRGDSNYFVIKYSDIKSEMLKFITFMDIKAESVKIAS